MHMGLAVKAPWLGPGETILGLPAWTGLENAIYLHLEWFISAREGCLGSEQVSDNREC